MSKPGTRGRPALKKGAGKSPVLQVVVSPELKAKAQRNGSQWVREVLTKAKEKTMQPVATALVKTEQHTKKIS